MERNTTGIIRGIENIKNLMINATSNLYQLFSYEQPDGLQYEYKNKITNTVVNVIRNVLISICQEFSPKINLIYWCSNLDTFCKDKLILTKADWF
jgi:hypothetical protein